MVDASTSFDEASATIQTALVLSDPGTSIDALQEIAEEKLVQATRAEILDHVGVEVIQKTDSTPLWVDFGSTKHMGGESLVVCTSGFVVSTSEGTEGIATAGHCSDALEDDNVDLDFQEAHEGRYGDFQWHTGEHPTPNRFYAGGSDFTEIRARDVDGVGIPRVGMQLCKNGITTHMSCDDVQKTSVCAGRDCKLVQMEHQWAYYGDSGGPVYSLYTAYGFVKGKREDPPHSGVYYDVFSRADQLDNALGLYIPTN